MKKIFSFLTLLMFAICANVSAANYDVWMWSPTSALLNAQNNTVKLYYRDNVMDTSDPDKEATFYSVTGDKDGLWKTTVTIDDESDLLDSYVSWYDWVEDITENTGLTSIYGMEKGCALIKLVDLGGGVYETERYYATDMVTVGASSTQSTGWNGNMLMLSDNYNPYERKVCAAAGTMAMYGSFILPAMVKEGEELYIDWADTYDSNIAEYSYGLQNQTTGMTFSLLPSSHNQYYKSIPYDAWTFTNGPASSIVYDSDLRAVKVSWDKPGVENMQVELSLIDDNTSLEVSSKTTLLDANAFEETIINLMDVPVGNYLLTVSYVIKDFYVGDADVHMINITLPDLTMHVLVNPDCGIDFSEGVWMLDADNNPYELLPDEYLGEGWYVGYMPTGMYAEHAVYVCNKDQSFMGNVIGTNQAEAYAEVNFYGNVVELLNGNKTPHDYRIVDVQASVKDYAIHVEWTAVDETPGYHFYVYDNTDTQIFDDYWWGISEMDIAITDQPTVDYTGAYVVMQPIDYFDNALADYSEKSNNFDLIVPDAKLGITKEEWAANNGSVTITWKADNDAVVSWYMISLVDDADNTISDVSTIAEINECTLDIPATYVGKAHVVVTAYTEFNIICGQETGTEKTLSARTLDNVKIHVLVTPDNGHDFNGNVYLWWNDGGDLNTSGACVKMNADAAQGADWYVATLTGGTTSQVQFYILSEQVDLGTLSAAWKTAKVTCEKEEEYYGLPQYYENDGRLVTTISPEETTHNHAIKNLQHTASNNNLTHKFTWEGSPYGLRIAYFTGEGYTVIETSGVNEYTINLNNYGTYNFEIHSMGEDGTHYCYLFYNGTAEPEGLLDLNLRFYVHENMSSTVYADKKMVIKVSESGQPDKDYELVREGETNWYSVNVKSVTEKVIGFDLILDPDGANYAVSGDSYVQSNHTYLVANDLDWGPSMVPCSVDPATIVKGDLQVTHADKSIFFNWSNCGYERIIINITNKLGKNVYYNDIEVSKSGCTYQADQLGEYNYSVTYVYNSLRIQMETSTVTLTKATKLYNVQFTPDGGGTIAPNPSGKYAEGAVIAVTAVPYWGYEFVQWSDGNTQLTRSITVGTEDINLVAVFVEEGSVTYHLTLTAGEHGTVEDVTGDYTPGTHVTLKATGDAGYKFYRWSDGVLGNPREFVMPNSDVTLSAEFVTNETPDLIEYHLTLSCGAGGSLNKANGVYSYWNGATVDLVATPNTGYFFEKWSDDNTNATRTITIDKDITLSASFVKGAVLNITAGTGGSVNSTVNGTYKPGEKVTITATADEGYQFVQWSDGDKNASREITMNADKSLSAQFQKEQVALNVKVFGGTYTVAPSKATYDKGEVVTITVTPTTGSFLHWGTEASVGSAAAYKSATVGVALNDAVTTLVAFCGTKGSSAYDLDVLADNDVLCSVKAEVLIDEEKKLYAEVETSGVFTKDAEFRLTATPKTGYSFSRWQDADKNKVSKNPMTFKLDKAYEWTAFVSKIVIPTYELSLTAGAGGKVNSDEADGYYHEGDEIEIIATPKSGYRFDKWSDGNKEAKRTYVMGNEDVTLKATFVKVYTLTINAGKGGSVNDDEANGTYDIDTEVEIIATPAEGYQFVKWSDGNKQAKRTLVMDDDYELTAEFEKLPEGLENVSDNVNVIKRLVNGQLIITRGDSEYNAMGAHL